MAFDQQVPAPTHITHTTGPITSQVIQFEWFLGDPCRKESCINYEKQLTQDLRDEFPHASVDALNQWGFYAYYVPESEGGRLRRFDEFVIMIRCIARRDLTVAIAHAKTFLGGAPIWIRGNHQLKAKCASLILAGHPVALGLTEKAHGSDLFNNECTLLETGAGGYLLSGEKWLINNATRASAITLHCNVSRGGAPKGSALAFVVKSELVSGSFHHLPREPLLGIRGADISGIAFNDTHIDEQQLVGPSGAGLEIALSSLQLSRILCCGLALGAGDSALRISLRQIHESRQQVRQKAGYADTAVVDGFSLQLAAECMTWVACRAVHVLPEHVVFIASIAKYMVPTTIERVFETMAPLHKLSSFTNTGLGTTFQKFRRDSRIVSLFDGSTIINLQSLVPQIRQIADAALGKDWDPVDANNMERLKPLFAMTTEVPQYAFSRLRASYQFNDIVLGSLNTLLSVISSLSLSERSTSTNVDRIEELVNQLRASYQDLIHQIQVHPNRLSTREPAMFGYAKRYCEIYVAGCCCFTWHFNREVLGNEFAQGDWLIMVLERAVRCEVEEMDGRRFRLLAWVQRLYQEQLAFSILPVPTIFASWDANH